MQDRNEYEDQCWLLDDVDDLWFEYNTEVLGFRIVTNDRRETCYITESALTKLGGEPGIDEDIQDASIRRFKENVDDIVNMTGRLIDQGRVTPDGDGDFIIKKKYLR